MHKSFTLYGHRGARGLVPENSIPGYEKAIKLGVDFVDMDVGMTKDKVMVVQHDLTLDPHITRDKNGAWITQATPINQITLEEVQQYDVGRIHPDSKYFNYFPKQQPIDGTHIPTLKQAIQYVKSQGGDKIKFQIEIKHDPVHPENCYSPREMAQTLADIIHEENITDRTEVQAFNWQCLYELQQIDPHIATAYLTSAKSEKQMQNPDPKIAGVWTGGKLLKDYDNSLAKMIKALGGTLWDPQDVEMTPQKVMEAHEQGLRVVTWSSPSTSGKDIDLALTEKVIDMGVDGVITDRPDEVLLMRK